MATVNKQAVAAAFGRAASGYTQHDELQRRCADLLLRQLARRDFAQVLDAGCGPGSMSRYWREAGSVVTALDLSAGMLGQAQRNDAAQHYLLGILRRCRCRTPASIWRGAIWRCSGATIYGRQLASCTGWRVPAAEWRLARCSPTRCRSSIRRGRPSTTGRMPTVSLAKRRCARRLAACARPARFIRLACRSPMR